MDPPPPTTPASPLLLSVAAIRAVEVRELARLPEGVLMERAATAVARAADRLLRDRSRAAPALLLVGPGNNGADALLTGLMLHDAGYPIQAILMTEPTATGVSPSASAPPAANFLQRWRARQQDQPQHVRIDLAADLGDDELALRLAAAAVVIEGLFGIGQTRPLSGQAARLIAALNRQSECRRPADPTPAPAVIAIDVPCGLDADLGSLVGGAADALACRADVTVTMIADKPGLRTGRGKDFAGRVIVADLGLDVGGEQPGGFGRLIEHMPAPGFRPRRTDTHKGSFGTLLIAGGARGMQGAALLAAGGAQAVGIGKLAISSPDEVVFDPGQPQWMTRGWQQLFDPRPDAVVAGCGLGSSPAAVDGLRRLLATDLPLVLDADALSLIASDESLRQSLAGHIGPRVLTPHPLEAARLLGVTAADVQRDRVGAATRLARDSASVVILKGAGSVIADRQRWSILTAGGPTLASAGTGDVLAGVVGALLAQGLDPFDAAQLAAWAHGKGGDLAQRQLPASIGLRAAQLPDFIRTIANGDDSSPSAICLG